MVKLDISILLTWVSKRARVKIFDLVVDLGMWGIIYGLEGAIYIRLTILKFSP
jgi:hypothetical protein